MLKNNKLNTDKFFRRPRLYATGVLASLLLLPDVASALSIGEITLQSKWGEPLQASVGLSLAEGERIEDACLSLVQPETPEDSLFDYLTKVRLTIKTDGKQQFVAISSHRPFEELFARFRLQIKCPGMGAITKTLTILPDLNESPLATPVVITRDIAPEAASVAAAVDTEKVQAGITPGAPPPRNELPKRAGKQKSRQAAQPANEPRATARPSRQKRDEAPIFKLKLSGDTIDETQIGKISAEERELLLARQKLLDADDQTAYFLAMQHQMKQLQDEIGAVKLRLAQLDASSTTVAETRAGQPQPPVEKPAITSPRQTEQKDNQALRYGLIVAGLTLAVLALLLGLRRYTRTRSQKAASLILEEPDSLQTEAPVTPPHIVTPSTVKSARHASEHAPAPAKAEPPKPPHKKIEAQLPEADLADLMMEEAELYAVHNRSDKAIEILRDIVRNHPLKTEAWLLLLSILSSLGKAAEFAQAARNFSKHHKGSSSWKEIQALGRTLDQNNPLYMDETSLAAAAISSPVTPAPPRRLIGDILVDMGALSRQEMKHYLDEFDPRLHGRFGGYLISRKVITHAQLDEALLQQQGLHTETKPANLPKLQDMENLLADFDPKLHGSVADYLASRNMATAEQLNQALPQQPGIETAKETPQTGELPVEDIKPTDTGPGKPKKIETMDFDFPNYRP